jgi:hypothetical protein
MNIVQEVNVAKKSQPVMYHGLPGKPATTQFKQLTRGDGELVLATVLPGRLITVAEFFEVIASKHGTKSGTHK